MAKTNEFEIYILVPALATAANTALDMTDYVDIADNEAFQVDEVDIVLDPTDAMPDTSEAVFQLADSNIQAFVSHSDRTSLYVSRLSYQGDGAGEFGMWHQESFSSLTPLIVNKTLFCRSQSNSQSGSQTLNHTLRLKGKIVKPSAKDYMALVLTQTGNVA
tara:strand:+ start:139 stop:621 length:483 start_codon:yes stop_codon:yes gene_type:complete